MGKKGKTKQARLDVFYKRAKASGYRARASFKLIQLNRKYSFLESARVCIDLCAAPGSWMQVASKYMPVSSIIVGVDLHDIAPIPNTISITGDIRTEKLRQELKGQLKTWKADVVLHDGAPNVGSNWLHDAYQQNLLVLHSFKLACEFLRKGGTFVTKVFRSKDHLSLEYIFRKLFRKVETTKPIASRHESAEIFVVCLGFHAPDKIDQQFFDAKYVFQTLEEEPSNKINIMKPEKTKRKAEGYEDGITMLFKKKNISEFIKSADFMDILEVTNEFEWDLLHAKESSFTTPEILEMCRDIKVLGRKELQALLKWRKNIRSELEQLKAPEPEEEKVKVEEKKDELELELDELEDIQKKILELQVKKAREERQHNKKVEKRKKKLDEKLKLRLNVPGDPGPQEVDNTGLFTINTLDKVSNLDNIVNQNAEILADSESDGDDEDRERFKYFSKEDRETKLREKKHEDNSESEDSEAEGLNLTEEEPSKKFDEAHFDDDVGHLNPLVTDLVGDRVLDKKERKAEKWFSEDIFGKLDDEKLEDFELDAAVAEHKNKGGKIRVKMAKEKASDEPSEEPRGEKRRRDEEEEEVGDAPDSDDDGYVEGDEGEEGEDSSSEEEEESPEEKAEKAALRKKHKKAPKLDAVGKALATKMLKSKKTKRDIFDDAWNRHMFNDDDLPDFFVDYENKFNTQPVEVDQEDLKMYQEQDKKVDSRTIKKVVEAKARKQRKLKKRLARARKKAEVVASNYDMTSREKASEMKKIYMKATSVLKPKDVKYVVMKKHFGGSKPKDSKGPSKMVDKRQKKDKRAASAKEKRKKKKGKR